MKTGNHSSLAILTTGSNPKSGERGAALATAILMLALLSAIAMTVLSVVTTESRIAGSDLARTNACYASAAGIEKMTSQFSSLFNRTSRPTLDQLDEVAADYPTELTPEGYTFDQTIELDAAAQATMGANARVTIPSGPFGGLIANLSPYKLKTTATSPTAQCNLEREMNNYLIPLFQFGMFSDKDIELHPGPPFIFNGRVHANGNIYVRGDVTFLAKVTTANEFVFDVLRNGSAPAAPNVRMRVGAITVQATKGSMSLGPNITTATATPAGQRGYFPGSPDGTINASWNTTSVSAAAAGVPNKFGGQLLTRTTGAGALKLPLQLDGNPSRELIKRQMPNDSQTLGESRYHSKAQIRILIDDENPATADASGIPAGQGLALSAFSPIPLPNKSIANNGGRALWRVPNAGGNAYTDTSATCVLQQVATSPSPAPTPTPTQAMTVRGVKSAPEIVTLHGTATRIPAGAGLTGRILIQIVDPDGVARDVTREILSMGVTVGEPNAIVHLQRPLWAAFTQGSRDSTGGANSLTALITSYLAADGEIRISSTRPALDGEFGYLTDIEDDTSGRLRAATTPPNDLITLLSGTAGPNWASWNAIVPINVYNPREGPLSGLITQNAVYERGITNVVELNMRNLTRWLDGVYDENLLLDTGAVSANIGKPDGYVVYVSDRRGDRVRVIGGLNRSNGMADNEDIYGPNGVLDTGEDVQETGALIKEILEIPDPLALVTAPTYGTNRTRRAIAVAAWKNPLNYFRGSVRLFNGENLLATGAANKLSTTLGITVATENIAYIWGNYNTTGINVAPVAGVASLNDPASASRYSGNQVPASIVCDAFFPLSKTWVDSGSAMYPDDLDNRLADRNLPAGVPGVNAETSVRVGIIAGNNLSAKTGNPDAGNAAWAESRLNGGMHNFPRFLENWNNRRFNFVGTLIPLYYSTQALGQYNANSTIYSPPARNWAFDTTFLQGNRLPPGTPMFQYIEPTAFRQVLY